MKSRYLRPFSPLPGHLLAPLGLLVSVLAVLPVSADDFTWDGSQTSNDWDALGSFPLDTNWTLNSIAFPSTLDTVTFPNSASDHTVYLNSNRSVSSVTITGGSGYLIGDDSTQYALTLGSGAITASGGVTHQFGANADIVLGANGTWKVFGTTTLEIDSNISGNFTLTKTGTGTLILTNKNTYNGDTTISGGTLRIGSGGTSGTIDGDIVNNSALSFNRSNSVSFAGDISGSGALTQAGTGTLTLTGTNTYSGGTTVSAGTLQVASGSTTGTEAVQVNSAATVSGTGSVPGTLTIASGATVAPGSSGMGTLTAVGTVTLNGTYDFQADGNQSDLLAVGGALDFGGTLDITSSNLTRNYYVATTYGSLTGSPTANNLPADFTLHTSLPSGYAAANGLATKSVALIRDLVPPVITLQGDDPVTFDTTNLTYTEEGATAIDNFDDNVAVTIGGDTVDPSVPGTYIVTYDATDSHGNAAAQATRTVEVLPDPTNTALGTNAGSSMIDSTFNSFFGFDAGRYVTSGSQNTILGEQAGVGLLDVTLGDRIDTGAVLTTAYNASENVFVGYRAGWQATTGMDNVFLGWNAGANSGASHENTFIGSKAGFNNTVGGNDNTFIGYNAGFQNTTGDDNTFIGRNAGAIINTGSDNTAIGSGALSNKGAETRLDPVAGASYSNTAVGVFAGEDVGNNGTTWNNTFVGAYAGVVNGAGRANSFFGAQAGTNNGYADYCTFVGAGAGFDNNRGNGTSEANRNSYLGMAAGFSNREGSDNVVIGAFADFGSWRAATDAQLTDAFDSGISPGFSNLAADLPYPRNWNRSVIIGGYATAGADDAISVGYGADATSERAIAIGSRSSASHADSIAIGYQAASHGDAIAVIGNGSTVSIDPGTDGATALGSTSYRYSEANAKTFNALADAGAAATVNLMADAGTNDNDNWRLQAANSGAFTISSFSTGAYANTISVENTGMVTIAGDLVSNSDLRLKENLRGIDNALALLATVEGKTYHWLPQLGRDDRTRYGFVAQEVEAAIPELVTISPVNSIKSVNYQGFIPILTAAMTELGARNACQQDEITLLREQIALQQQLLQQLSHRSSAKR